MIGNYDRYIMWLLVVRRLDSGDKRRTIIYVAARAASWHLPGVQTSYTRQQLSKGTSLNLPRS